MGNLVGVKIADYGYLCSLHDTLAPPLGSSASLRLAIFHCTGPSLATGGRQARGLPSVRMAAVRTVAQAPLTASALMSMVTSSPTIKPPVSITALNFIP